MPAPIYSRGLANQDKRDYQNAIADFTHAIKLDPKNAAAYQRARLLLSAACNDDEHAFQDFDQAIKLNPNFGAAYYNRGMAHYERRELDPPSPT